MLRARLAIIDTKSERCIFVRVNVIFSRLSNNLRRTHNYTDLFSFFYWPVRRFSESLLRRHVSPVVFHPGIPKRFSPRQRPFSRFCAANLSFSIIRLTCKRTKLTRHDRQHRGRQQSNSRPVPPIFGDLSAVRLAGAQNISNPIFINVRKFLCCVVDTIGNVRQ